MATVNEYIQAICPRLFASPTLDVYTSIGESMCSSSFFGSFYNYAVALSASHNFAVDASRPDGSAGLVTSKSEGRLSVHYWNEIPKGSHSDYHMTSYGKKLVALIHRIGGAASVSNPEVTLDGTITIEGFL